MTESIVGVIGGMGPEATVELMRRVIAATPAADDADHIHMIVDNNPKVPSRIKALIEGAGDNPGPEIATMARRLAQAGADFLVMPCNTAHHYWTYAAEAVDVPVWHLVDLTLGRVAAEVGAPARVGMLGSPARVGMLGSPALRRVQLYESHCAAHGVSLLYPEREEALLEVIRAVKTGSAGEREIETLNRAARQLADAGAEAVVLGCTEFSLIGHRVDASVPILDTLQVLAEEIVTRVKARAIGSEERERKR